MAKEYSRENILESQTFADHIDIHVWLEKIANEEQNCKKMWEFLKDAGRYFDKVLPGYPEYVSIPIKVERGFCHQNNLSYAEILCEKHIDILSDFRFVTGLWLRKAKHMNALSSKNYCIGAHSFMTYKGGILDCTMLKYPPSLYEIVQYFGISFHIPDVLKAFKKVKDSNGDLSKIPVMEVLRETPYLKQ